MFSNFNVDPKYRFAKFRQRYYEVETSKYRIMWYCYSVTKNANGKYLVFNYRMRSTGKSQPLQIRELNKKKDAIKWAKQRMLNHLKALGRHSELAKWAAPEKLTQVEII